MTKIIFCVTLFFSHYCIAQLPADAMTVNQQRMEERLAQLALFGKDSSGHGYRVAYTSADVQARTWFISLLQKLQLHISIDAAGNIIATRKGKNPSLKPIAFGSHLDMVPDGGNYDGCVGSIGALEVMNILYEKNITTEHPLELLIFSNEEGGTVGSNAMAGHLAPAALQLISQSGLTMAEGIKTIGGEPGNITASARAKGALSAFLELHIEQGGILDKEKIQIGVVEGIVGIEHWNVIFEGFSNHAGTTPMDMRQDALLAAARFIIAVNETVTGFHGRQVATVGKLSVLPGAYNVIPGRVQAGLEIRDLSYDTIWKLFHAIENKAAAIAKSSNVRVKFEYQANPAKPALTDKKMQEKIIAAARQLGLSYKFIQSGAGHDSQEMALIAPVAMIFVPSVGGISHSPKEFSTSTDIANGTRVLLSTILQLDKE